MSDLPQLKFDSKRTRVKLCPCGKRNNDSKFAPYVGFEDKGYCHSCGQTFLPEINNGLYTKKDFPSSYSKQTKKEKIDFLPKEISAKSLQFWNKNNFTEWLISLFGFEETEKICKLFHVGSSRHWKHSTMFWQVDINGNLRQATIILYNSENGKRVKKGSSVEKWNYKLNGFESEITNTDCVKVYGRFLSKETQKLNLLKCFFGEHQINKFPGKKIGIAESQKTAVLLSFFYPEYIWLATGGKNGCNWTDSQVCKVLENREVVLFPDKGIDCFNLWNEKADEIKSKVKCKIIVSDILENSKIANEIEPGEDLADYFLKQIY